MIETLNIKKEERVINLRLECVIRFDDLVSVVFSIRVFVTDTCLREQLRGSFVLAELESRQPY